MQASQSWTAPGGTLATILSETAERVERLRAVQADLGRRAGRLLPPASFRQTLVRADVAVIAEVKRRSPSKGWINRDIRVAAQASEYAAGGAAAISVLTEPHHFDGRTEDLEDVSREVSIPLLKKDFHVDTLQLLEARAYGAAAVLLIARALAPERLARLIEDADRLLLESIVEVRDEWELERALSAGATMIGVNNRNLETLEIDPATSERLIPSIPANVVAIAESGVEDRGDVERLAGFGADAVLVGSSLSAAANPRQAVGMLVGVSRQSSRRGR